MLNPRHITNLAILVSNGALALGCAGSDPGTSGSGNQAGASNSGSGAAAQNTASGSSGVQNSSPTQLGSGGSGSGAAGPSGGGSGTQAANMGGTAQMPSTGMQSTGMMSGAGQTTASGGSNMGSDVTGPGASGGAAAGSQSAGEVGGASGAMMAGAGGAQSGGGQPAMPGGGSSAMGNTESACSTPADGQNPNRLCIKGKEYYLNGINVAWDQWTADLTNYDAASFEGMFSTLEASGGNAIRWWWFIDGESQLTFQGNLVQPLSDSIFQNLDMAFDSAAAHGILIMPVLLSFDIMNQSREFLVTDEAATDAFVTNVVQPLVERYNDHPALGLWEIMNEGDWLLTDEMGTVSTADYQRFHAKVAAGIHAAKADALVTTGSASFKYLESDNNILSDAELQAAAGGDALAYLDVYQTHYYSWMHGDGWSYEPWIQTCTEWQGDGKPVLIGEFPCIGEADRWSSMQMHTESVNQGYAGTFCWAYFDNRMDDEGTWADAKPGVEAIAAQVAGAQ